MSVIALLKDIKDRGIRLWVEDNDALGFKGPKGALTRELAAAIKANKPAIIEILQRPVAQVEPPHQAPPIANEAPPALEGRRRPTAAKTAGLSSSQKRFYFIEQLQPGSLVYHMPGAVTLHGPLKADALERTFRYLIERHEVLRTCFAEHQGEPYPVVLEQLTWNLAHKDLSDLEMQRRQQETTILARWFFSLPFDLAQAPLLRAMLIKHTDEQHVLLWNQHHIISDDWSMQIFFEELTVAYSAIRDGQQPPLPPQHYQFSDYVAWQHQSQRLAQDEDWWENQLVGAPSLRLPTDAPRPPLESHHGRNHPIHIDAELAAAVVALAKRTGCSPFMVYLAAFGLVFQRLAAQDDFVVGTTFSNRDQPEWERVMGLFINTLPLRLQLSEPRTVEELLARVAGTCLQAFARGQVPFESIVERLQLPRDRSRHPLYQVLFTFTNAPKAEVTLGDLRAEPLESGESGVARMDMTISLDDREDGVQGHIEYNRDLFEAETIRSLMARVEHVLRQITAPNPAELADIELLLAEERPGLLQMAAGAPIPLERPTLPHQFREAASAHPDQLAVFAREGARSYGEVLAEVDEIAGLLQHRGIGPGNRVAVCLPRDTRLPAALLAVLSSGAAYVPLDPKWPDGRIAMALEDARPDLVLVTPATASKIVTPHIPQLDLEEEHHHEPFTPLDIDTHHLAYILFTSGSTGRPKGVAISHANLSALAWWAGQTYPAEDLAGVFAATPVTFDISVFELLVTLALSGAIILGENALDLIGHPQRDKIRLMNTVPSAMAELVNEGEIPPNVRRVNLAGEALTAQLLENVLRRTQVTEVFNLYGPTEDTVYTTMARFTEPTEIDPMLGQALPGEDLWVTDRRGRLQPLSVAGELLAGGPGLACGYYGKPALTAERFIPHPYSQQPGQRLYKTGDLVRRDGDGNIHYIGRIDHQVKINGYRIELGEINFRMRELAAVREAEVIVREQGGFKRLVAFVRPHDAEDQGLAETVRTALSRDLPAYMVPTAIIVLPALPLTPNGKVDKRALAAMPLPDRDEPSCKLPLETATQQLLAETWEQLIGLEPDSLGREADFFAVGGHSLMAGRVAARLRSRLGVEVPIRVFFDHPRLEALAAWLDEQNTAGVTSIREEMPQLGEPTRAERPPHIPLSFSQLRLWLLEQMAELGDTYHIPLVLALHGPLRVTQLAACVARLYERHEALRTVFRLEADQPVQYILPPRCGILTVIDLSARPDQLAETQRQLLRQPFELGDGPLSRFGLFRLGAERHVLAICLHHLIADGWSLGLLFRELIAGYEGTELAEVYPYPDFALWQQHTYTHDRMAVDLAWWRHYLHGLPEELALPTDHPRGSKTGYNGRTESFTMARDASTSARRLAQDQRTTLFTVMLSTFALVLHRISGQRDLAIGTPIAGRRHERLEHTIGCFINSLALRSSIGSDSQPFQAYLGQLRDGVLDAFHHQDLPFEKLVEHLYDRRTTARSPIFQVMFSMHQSEDLQADLDGLRIEMANPPSETAQYEMTLVVVDDGDRLRGELVYNTDLFAPQTARFVLARWRQILTAVTEQPQRALHTLYQQSAEERSWLAASFDRRDEASVTRSLPAIIQEYARARPDQPSVVTSFNSLSYRELVVAARALTLNLRDRGIVPGDVVGLSLNQSETLTVAVLAVHMLGAAYLALDARFPKPRLAYMCEDAGCRLVIGPARPDWLPQHVNWWTLNLERETADTMPAVPLLPDALAYIVYTSGTTGKPKGIGIPNRALINMAEGTARARGLARHDRVLQFASMGFDVFAEDYFSTLTCGATLVMRPSEGFSTLDHFTDFIATHAVSLADIPVGWWAEWIHALQRGEVTVPASLHTVIVGGEAVPRDMLESWRALAPGVAVINSYGPSETCVTATSWRDEGSRARIGAATAPIGAPIAGLYATVCDPKGRPVSPGYTGELLIGGAGLARGYVGRPALTALSFVPDPDGDGERLYRTGDLVRHLPGEAGRPGMLEFIGRRDHQVKIRGYRIEPREVEAVLREHPAVRDARVIALSEAGETRLVAYLIPAKRGVEPNWREMVAELEKLPSYMYPHRCLWLERFPLRPTGKIDERELGGAEEAGQTPTHVPTGTVLARVIDIWQEILAVPVSSPDANYFALGGHSLSAVRLMGRLNRHFGIELSLAHLIEAATPRAQATLIEALQAAPDRVKTHVNFGLAPGAAPLYLVHAATGNLLPYGELAQALGARFEVHGFQAADSRGASLPELARRYLEEANLLERDSVTLVGWSLGGLIAWEMAAQLERAGRVDHRTILLDTYPLWELPTQTPSERLAAFARDIGLSHDQIEELARRVPEHWDGDRVTELGEALAGLQAIQRDWTAAHLQIIWQNYTAHLQAACAYRPQQLKRQPLLLAARDLGNLAPAWQCWREAGFELEHDTVAGDHHGLLDAAHLETLTRAITAGASVKSLQEIT